jgi:glycosyltransferase involved in cell wall biosynthesis
MKRRILYLQFQDPAAYPPLEHSSQILANGGWSVVFIGAAVVPDAVIKFPTHPNIRTKTFGFSPFLKSQPVRYLYFTFKCLFWTLIWRPMWIYGSDLNVLPALWLIRKVARSKIIYHEHDSPNAMTAQSSFRRLALWCRKSVGRDADLCVLPQQQRLDNFIKQTQRQKQTLCIWNCPSVTEVSGEVLKKDQPLLLYYHGSINAARIPLELVESICRFKGDVQLLLAGYEVQGSIGYVEDLKQRAHRWGVPSAVNYVGAIPLRDDLLRIAGSAHVGLSLMPMESDDINLLHMVGASNKPFDCMASGLPLLVSRLGDWVTTFVEPGFARACDPRDPDSIERELRWYLQNPSMRIEMGRRCLEKVRDSWNYENMFEGAAIAMEGTFDSEVNDLQMHREIA